MSKVFIKLMVAISCFLPLYFIYFVKNIIQVYVLSKELSSIVDNNLREPLIPNLIYNIVLVVIWIILILFSIIGICQFKHKKIEKMSKETITIIKSNNITPEYYFTYFSLFVVSFVATDTTDISRLIDVVCLVMLLALMIFVYIKNDMYFISPVLNIIGYRSYDISYYKGYNQNNNDTKDENKAVFEIKVLTKEKLEYHNNNNYFLTYSPYDFSICYKKKNSK